jgi:integration host factor subunit beta
VTKAELIKYISLRYPEMMLKEVQELVNVVFDEISMALVQNRRIELRGFGAFSLRSRKARKARNPKTNEIVQLKERFVPYFRAGKELREMLNSDGTVKG